MRLNGSQIVIQVLLEHGVDTVFGYPGGAALNIYDELYKNRDKITHVTTAHEQGAAHAADGYSRSSGKTGVVFATSGPGATNLVTGIATAYMDSIPMVAITANVGTSLIGKDSFQEIYIVGVTMPVTKHNFVVRNVNELADILRRAFQIANSGRPGPVLVDIPKDISAAYAEYEYKEPLPLSPFPEIPDLTEAAAIINEAKMPFIYYGGGVRLSHSCKGLKELTEKAQIPAGHTIMGTGILSEDYELNLGMMGMHGHTSANRAVAEADVVIAIGTRFSDRVALNPDKFARRARVIHIDIDSSEIGKNVKPDIGIQGNVADVLEKLLPLVKPAKHEKWIEQIREWQAQDYTPVDSETELKPHQIIRMVNEKAGDDAIYVTDVGQHQMWAAQYLHHEHPRNFLTSGGLGTMGFGYGAAIGAQFANPGRRVIHFTGDGSFHMNMNEACTAVSYNLPIITIIINNEVLGMVRQWQTAFYESRYSATDLHRKTNYAAVAAGFGAYGFSCSTPAELKDALDKAFTLDGPVWIECKIGKDESVYPMIPAGMTVDDTITG